MATDLDLDINHYTISDIESFFQFKPKSKYSKSDVELRETEIRERFLSSGHINKKLKRDLLVFLKTAKQWLIEVKCEDNPTPTTIPKNYRLDTDQYPRSQKASIRENDIIVREPNPYIDYRATPNHLNPIEKRVISRLLCIDTLFRPNYNKTKSTDFVYSLPETINNVISMKVVAAEIPNMWYSFSSENKNNTFTIELFNVCATDHSGNIIKTVVNPSLSVTTYDNYVFTITIPDGNYCSDSFDTMIKSILYNQTMDDNGKHTIALRFINISTNLINTTVNIRANNEIMDSTASYTPPCAYDPNNEYYCPDFYFVVDFGQPDPNRPIYKNLGWMMGFRKSRYIVNRTNVKLSYSDNETNTITYIGYLSSESSFGSMSDNYLFIEIDDYHNNFTTDTVISMNNSTSSFIGKNILARITVSSGSNSIINNNAGDYIFRTRDYFGPIKLEKMNIRLLNRFGDLVQLNQNDYSFALEITQLYS
jgi:hypothetical protein